MSLLRNTVQRFGEDLGAPPAFLDRFGQFLKSHRREVFCGLLLFFVFQQAYFWTGIHFHFNGLLDISDILYGWDVPRVIHNMTDQQTNERSSVHPLFTLFTKPFGRLLIEIPGSSRNSAAVAITATTGGLLIALVMAYFLVWGAQLVDAVLFATLFGCAWTPYLSSVVPETGIFAMLATTFSFFLLACALIRGRESQWLWILAGVFTYGITMSNFAKTGVSYFLASTVRHGLIRAIIRSALYGIAVVGIAVVLTLGVGSTIELRAENNWIIKDDPNRGGAMPDLWKRLAREFLIYPFVAPTPSVERVTFPYPGSAIDELFKAQDLDPIIEDELVASFNEPTHKPWFWPLAALWVLLLSASIIAALLSDRPHEKKILALFLFFMVFDFIFFSNYYVVFEGLIHWSVHIIASVYLLTAYLARRVSTWPKGGQSAFRGGLALFIVAIAINNFISAMENVRLLTQ